jgi:hypothetical protein
MSFAQNLLKVYDENIRVRMCGVELKLASNVPIKYSDRTTFLTFDFAITVGKLIK